MITPPLSTTSSYSAMFAKSAAHLIAGLVAPENARDLTQAFLTSKDLGSDIEAINELRAGFTNLSSDLFGFDEKIDILQNFNPIYLPQATNIEEQIEVDGDGDIDSVAGFGNPYVSMTLKYGSEAQENLMAGSVSYQQFMLPGLHELIGGSTQLLS